MANNSPEPARRTALRPWLIILMTGPLVVLLAAFGAYRWQSQKKDFARLADQFAQRQNRVLAHDAMTVAGAFSALLAQGARDARLLSAAGSEGGRLSALFEALRGGAEETPRYNRLIVWELGGDLKFFEPGIKAPKRLKLSQCGPRNLCDRATLDLAVALPPGKARVGKGMRWYTPEKSDPSIPDEGTLSVAYRAADAIYLLGIDFRAFYPIVRLPTFPYQERSDVLKDYDEGSYIYLLDRDADLLAHPRRWHVMGLDRETGLPVPPMRTDSDAGTHPLNFRAYREGRLRPYFDRLLAHSFQGGPEVDVFQAANLSGLVRVVSIAPVFLDAALFDQKGAFGYVGVGCAVDNFSEPEERLVPYY